MKKTLSQKILIIATALSIFFGVAGLAFAELVQWDYPEAGKCRVTNGSTSWDGTMEYDGNGNPTCVKPSASQAETAGLNHVLAIFGGIKGGVSSKTVWNYFNTVYPQASTKS